MNTVKGLIWGVTTAAAQTEGAFDKDGKGPSIWDEFTKKTHRIKDGSNAKVATDFYHRYKEDIQLASDIGLKIFRFSISWSRILPDGTGTINQKGIDFYNRVIDYCIKTNIEPWITTYHWDLPQKLQDQGGWTNRKIIDWYADYVQILRDHFADRVKYWVLINEGIVCIGGGYFLGVHAPGKRGVRNFISSTHHLLLAQAEGFRVLKQIKELQVGAAISCTKIEAYRNTKSDRKAAEKIDTLMNRLFIEPHLGLGYPTGDLPFLKRISRYCLEGDLERLEIDFDFLGIQTYTREVVKNAWYIPYLGALLVRAGKRNVPVSIMGWETYTEGIPYFLERFSKYDSRKALWLSECGMALSEDEDDQKRIEYYEKVIEHTQEVLTKDIQLKGILLWTLVDNFEWAEGYIPKFGIVDMDMNTLERKMKKTAYWFKNLLKNKTP
ncbi:glycoside hydrolase family 1 protein [Aquimarina sp. 2201CG5-10]|uniref:glycoside hydrolase family 1 protein n=1 Tax=Aquimarina callyspongiae TaxID=3098150 RepID=UPI002AB5CE90|nr:family 1 glycosylhydrolase [Aquimarina sp. 2201CG5-10]MDY8136509.1 family 1 glycosylhydrolase [Aquimarina sp. 2201CG5-10]